ncbi:MAG TPA: TIM barrel protein [Tepidisphaeraceae bacterium]|nr:TIM barrel protein [Tepidisphaeraceae bacterium]
MAMIIGTQAYTWHQYCEGEGKKLADELDRVLGEVAAAGLKAWEGTISHEAEADQHAALLEKHGLSMPSMYTGARLHDPEWRAAADEVVARGRLAKRAGTRWLVVNPDPLRWGAKEDKTDDQLRRQAEALRYIGRALDEQGQMLVYHAHDMEMRNAAREFHHMLRSTADLPVGWCLDAHWAFRGAGDAGDLFREGYAADAAARRGPPAQRQVVHGAAAGGRP